MSNPAAPVATQHNQTGVTPGTSIALSTLFTYTVASGDVVLGFDFDQTTNEGGSITDNYGNKLTPGQLYGNAGTGIPISELSQYHYIVGPSGTFDSINFNVEDEYNQVSTRVTATVSAATPAPPTATILESTATLSAGQSISLSSLFATSDSSPGRSVTAFAVRDRTAGGTGVLKYNGGTPPNGQVQSDGTILYDAVPISELSQWSFVAGSATESDTIGFQAIDNAGTYSTAVVSTITTQAVVPPTATILESTATLSAGQSISLSSLFATSDSSPGRSVTAFAVRDRTAGGTGVLKYNGGTPPNGQVQSDGTILYDAVPISELSQWSFVAGSATESDTIGFQAIDNAGTYSTAVVSTITTQAVVPPTATILESTATLSAGQSISLSSLFATSDSSPGRSVTAFAVRDRTAGGTGVLKYNGGTPPNGQVQSDGTILYDAVPISELSQWSFVAGSATESDTIGFQAIDNAGTYSTAVVSTITTQAVVPPTATILESTATLSAGQSISLSSLFATSDSSPGRSVTAFAVRDRTAGGTGVLKYNGGTPPNGQVQSDGTILYDAVPISELSQWSFVAGSATESDTIGFQAIDNAGTYSTAVVSTITTQAPGTTTLTVGSGNGIIFDDTFTANCTQSYISCVVSAETAIRSLWTNSITLSIEFDAEPDGITGPNDFLAENSASSYVGVTYAQLNSALASHEFSSYAQAAVSSLPSSDPNPAGGSDWSIPEAYARMLGLSTSTPSIDDTVTLNSSYDWSYGQDVINTIEHEISEGGMGRIGGLGDENSRWSTMDLFRFNSSGSPDYEDGRDGQSTYFSYNGGSTLSLNAGLSFNNEYNSNGTQSNTNDTADFIQQDVFGTGLAGESNTFSQTDQEMMDVLGWNPVESAGGGNALAGFDSEFFPAHADTMSWLKSNTNLAWCGYYLDAPSQRLDTGWLGEESYLQSVGWKIAPIYVGQQDPSYNGGNLAYAPSSQQGVIDGDNAVAQMGPVTSATQVVYDYDTATGEYDIQKTVTQGQGFAAGTTVFLDLEYGEITNSPNAAADEAYVLSWCQTVANAGYDPGIYCPYTDAAPLQTILQQNSLNVSFWVADPNWLINDPTEFTVGPTTFPNPDPADVSDIFTGSGYAEATAWQYEYEPGYSIQTVNGAYTIDLDSSTLYSASSDDTVSETAPLSIVATDDQPFAFTGGDAVQITDAGAGGDTFKTVITDTLGILTATGGGVSGSSSNDLTITGSFSAVNTVLGTLAYRNASAGTDTIVVTTTDQTTSQSTSPADISVTINLADVIGETAPGSTVTAVAGASKAISGVAVTDVGAGTDSFTTVVSTANGGLVSATAAGGANLSGVGTQSLTVSGTLIQVNAALATLSYSNANAVSDTVTVKTSDANASPTSASENISVITEKVLQTDGSTSLVQAGSNYYLYAVGTTTGPELSYLGAPVTVGEFTGWAPIGAVKTASGYDVALKNAGAGEYAVWSTDSNGNYITNLVLAVPATNSALETLETTFGQDLNGDGQIGPPPPPPPTVIATDGATSLALAGSNYYLYAVGTTTGPELSYQATPVTVGEFTGWAPIGAVKTASGYDVALKNASAGEYAVWSTDSNGNYVVSLVAGVPATNSALETLETTFDQDLNGDGQIGPPPPPAPTVIATDGATSLALAGSNYYLYAVGTTTGPELSYQGTPVTVGEFTGWALIGAVKTASGYDVALKNAGAGEYAVWSTASNGNYITNLVLAVPATNSALETLETTFGQDLNGDGQIGPPQPPPPTVIATDGATSLALAGSNYYLYAVGTTTGPELSYQGTPVTVGEFTGWAPIGAVKTASGYDVALKDAGAGEYAVWSTDSNGNYITSLIAPVPATNYALETLETTFDQDLNGDGQIGPPQPPPPTVIATDGATSLALAGSNYYLYAVGTTTGPELSYQGTPVTVGEFTGWAPIGAVKTASGYDVALKNASAGEYAVWSTDSNGNYITNLIPAVTATNSALETLETTFDQDLNGDGQIGPPPPPPPTVIATDGATSLALAGNNYYLYAVGTTTGPELSYQATPVTVGEFTGWAPIGAVKTASGYDVALKNASAGEYAVWSTDSNGNYITNLIPAVTATNSALETLETTFGQDLNGDGIIGVTSGSGTSQTTTIAAGATTEILAGYSGGVTFAGSSGTLKLDQSSSFAGTVAGMSGQDTIDFADINFASVHQPSFSGTGTGGTLSVTDGTHSANIALLGNYLASTFVASSDGHGGTAVVDPLLIASTQPPNLTQPQNT